MKKFKKQIALSAALVTTLSILSVSKVFAQPWNQGYFKTSGNNKSTTKNNPFYFDDGLAGMGVTALYSNSTSNPKVDYKIYYINPDLRTVNNHIIGNRCYNKKIF